MKKAVIFGGNGQDGIFLGSLLKENGVQGISIARSSGICRGDVANFAFVKEVIKTQSPDYIFHFAANSTTAHDAIFENHEAISTGTINILEAARLLAPKAKVFISGSAMQFENNNYPISEKTPFAASSPYSISRIHAVYAARYYREKFNLQTYVGYFFNHDSEFRSARHINKKIIETAIKIKNGSREVLEIGNYNVKKEFNYARDLIEAVWLFINQEKIFEMVIGSGVTHSIKEWIELCFAGTQKNWEDFVLVKHNYVSEYDVLVSDNTLLKSIGWAPKVNIGQLVEIMRDGISKNEAN